MPSPPEPPEDEKQKKKKKPIKVRVSLYYDGTQNNRANTNVRKNVERGQASDQSRADYEKSLDLFAKHGMKGSSYDNDESNVSRMEGQSTNTAAGYDYYFHVYTEGAGTVDKGKDRLLGLGLAWFKTGIFRKVDAGIAKALELLCKKLPEGAVIDELAIDTCGFSRGAATARLAIDRVLNDRFWGPDSLKTQLEDKGFTVKKVEILAVCLFDTVSSYGLPCQHGSNVKSLKLDAISHAKAVFQLAAAEEYRENFSLTTIESAKNGRQVFLPGSHSDVGGCYEDGLFEGALEGGMVKKKEIYEGDGSGDIAKFLLDRGWCTKDQLVVADSSVKVARSGLLKEYSYIPLHLMAEFAKKQGLAFASALEKTFEVSGIESALIDELKRYANSTSDSKAIDWEMPRDDLNRLRNRYLHISYDTTTGMGMRVTKAGAPEHRTTRPYRWLYHDA